MRFIHERESMVDRYNAIPPEAQEIVAEVAAAHNTFKPFLFAATPSARQPPNRPYSTAIGSNGRMENG